MEISEWHQLVARGLIAKLPRNIDDAITKFEAIKRARNKMFNKRDMAIVIFLMGQYLEAISAGPLNDLPLII